MNPDAEETTHPEPAAPKAEKPRGKCTGCPFDYQLGTARTGEYKGQLVIRKHLSRVGPGECEGSRKPPAIEHGEATGDAQAFATDQFVDPAPVQDTCACGGVDPDCPNGCGNPVASKHGLGHCTQGNCTGCCGCSSMCTTDPCGQPEQLPHDRGHETITHIPNGHDFTDSSGTTWRHGGDFQACTTEDCVQFRNRLNPPPVDTPVQHQCEHGLYADIRNCPRHGVPTPVQKLAQHAAAAFPDPAIVQQVVDKAKDPGYLPPSMAAVAVAPGGTPVFVDPHAREADSAIAAVGAMSAPVSAFADPTPAPAELPPVSGQPEPERDQWGRYKILGVSHTRATTFAKLGSSTFALGEWNERMLIKGLVLRPDLLAMAHGLDVKRDARTLNKIADDAQEFAGNKVAANIGTAYHTFTERLDAGVMQLEEVPAQWRGRCAQYVDALAAHGLTTRREWIERTTAVRADQVSALVPVAGTLDRIFQMPDGSLVIGDLKTSSNIEYSWSEIAVQLALYAWGVNTFGLFDWNSKTWCEVGDSFGGVPRPVRTDYAIVMHLPADGDGCTMYRVDLEKGWRFAQVSGMVQSRQKAKDVAGVMVPLPQTVPAPVLAAAEGPAPAVRRPEMSQALILVASQSDPNALSPLHQYAIESGVFTDAELSEINDACAKRWQELNVPY
jgi:hypothetical protein